MNLKFAAGIAALSAASMAIALPASASYMETCNALIADWEKCRANGSVCKAEQKALEEQCKCHIQKGDEWKLVTAAVGKNGVCAPGWPEDRPPIETDPVPPPRDSSGKLYHNPIPPGREAPTKENAPAPEQRG